MNWVSVWSTAREEPGCLLQEGEEAPPLSHAPDISLGDSRQGL